jgi:hypothetical protein
MSDLHHYSLSISFFTLAGAALITACVEDPGTGPSDDGVVVSETGETGELPPDQTSGDGDGDNGGDNGDGDGDGESGSQNCESTTAIATNVPPNVILVLDKSRSMLNYEWDGDGDPQTPDVTRWHSLHDTVNAIATHYQDGMKLGVTLFPFIDATSKYESLCIVSEHPEVTPALGNAEAILDAIPDAEDTDFYGATPAAAGIATALAHLELLDGEEPAAMILVTDGAANCNFDNGGQDLFDVYDENLPLIVAHAWEQRAIPTYVIGIDIKSMSISPLTNPRVKLDEVAQLGGVALDGEVGFYDATDADMLLAALDEIASSVSCTVKLDEPPESADQLIIEIDGQTIPRLDSCDQGDGWVFSDPNGPLDSIELCNGSCDALLEAGELEAEFPCPPQP